MARRRAERLWGGAGADQLLGGSSRAACLFGGGGPDELQLGAGGGAAWGEAGADSITGSPIDDVIEGGDDGDVLRGGEGRDLIVGGPGLDGMDAGAGDDVVVASDRRAEIVDCGPGRDDVLADRADVLIDCEGARLAGPALPRLVPEPRPARRREVVHVRLRVREAAGPGGYGVLALTGHCAAAPALIASFPAPGRRVRAGQPVRIGLAPPRGGWCTGPVRAAVVRERSCPVEDRCVDPPPPEPVARLAFSVAGS